MGFDSYIQFNLNTEGPTGRIPKGQPGAGRFVTDGLQYRQEMRQSGLRHAMELQARVVENMRGGLIRRNVSSGRLVKVTGGRGNLWWSERGYGVGVEDYLDSSMAKYWRTIEEGSQVVWADVPTGRASIIGMELKGFWGGGARHSASRSYGLAPWSRHSPRRSDMFVPATGFRENGKFARFEAGEGGSKGVPSFVKSTTVKNEIAPHHDYRNAFRDYRPGERSLQEVQEILRKASAAAWSLTR